MPEELKESQEDKDSIAFKTEIAENPDLDDDVKIKTIAEFLEAIEKAEEYGISLPGDNPVVKFDEEFKFAKKNNDWTLAEKVKEEFETKMTNRVNKLTTKIQNLYTKIAHLRDTFGNSKKQ